MKKFMLFSMCAGLLAFTGIAFGTVTTFDGGAGLAGWTSISSGNALSSNTGYASWETFASLMQPTTPVVTNDFGVDGGTWGWDAAQILLGGASTAYPAAGSYVGFHYQAPAGQVITGVTLPRTYLAADTDMKLQITDAAGVVKAESVRTAPSELLLGLSATGLNTSSIDIRFTNTAGLWDSPLWANNGVIFNTVQVTTTPEPATMALLALGSLSLLRRKK